MNALIIKKHLQAVSLFKELSEAELGPIVGISQIRTYQAGAFAFMQGEPLDRVFFICSGKVKIHKSDLSGKEQIVSVLEAGDMFPHAGFFRNGNFPAHAEMLTAAELIVISVQKFEEILLENPALCIKMFRVLGEKVLELQSRLEEKILRNTYEQIVMLLLRLTQTNGIKMQEHYRLNSQFTNQELANMIGTTRETVNRTVNQLRKKGLIKQDESGYFLIDGDELAKEIL
ncbi:CRP/FNR family transcriptional regulator, anaerobic regulatory protein [Amphibacillus marinus]|uniref:CRP/FNR family transcriptional regulator, anaerobic regulatory protein n=1 Tax=Amphibacillus marinus TaxID=872970 RepID=A0A1H8S9L1_9BACI|nr:Crp/Fnr family transcriptional regulator [Amphibacillus marinus]SEO75247.1 CRP/FNR family transcriptional regulator, anaerobic regulatory protein [Amphibacillus marinus]